jgi:hypothetical protein
MLLYNWALVLFEDKFLAPNIYAAVYFVFIPISHDGVHTGFWLAGALL